MYVVGLKAQLQRDTHNSKTPDELTPPTDTETAFQEALEQLKSALPSDCISWNRDDLVAHGTSAWSC